MQGTTTIASTNAPLAGSITMHKLQRLIYWRTPWKTVLVLSLFLFLEIGLLYRSIISVFAWSGLMVMAYFTLLRIYVHFFPITRRSPSQVDFDMDVLDFVEDANLVENLSAKQDKAYTISDNTEEHLRKILNRINSIIVATRDMFLINNYVESLKLAFFLYGMTYVGAHFNFLTLLILATVIIFTVPKVYETFQPQIDNVLKLAKEKLLHVVQEAQRKLLQIPAVQALLPRSQGQSPNNSLHSEGNGDRKYH